jgi:hypothetical protein
MEHHVVTIDNIETISDTMAAGDQSDELCPGDETWGIIYQPGNQRGQMTRYANGRGAVCFGGDSEWGEWDEGILTIDNSGIRYDEDGEDVGCEDVDID